MKKITILSELKNEFAGHINRFKTLSSHFFNQYPKAVFSAMVLLMFFSLLLCFTLLRTESQKSRINHKALTNIGSGLSEIGSTVNSLQKTLEMRAVLKTMLSKDSLTSADSLLMVSMIAELEKSRGNKKTK